MLNIIQAEDCDVTYEGGLLRVKRLQADAVHAPTVYSELGER